MRVFAVLHAVAHKRDSRVPRPDAFLMRDGAIACEPIARMSESSLSMQCGSSWEVDLRADVDCDAPGLERCHPRYTLGWRHREVQLHRDGLSPPKGTEFMHAYCDVWRRGRLEQILATPAENARVRQRAERRLAALPANNARTSSDEGAAGCHDE